MHTSWRVRITKDGVQMASGKNLGCVLRYGREKSPVRLAKAYKDRHSTTGSLVVNYCDGSVVQVDFASYAVLCDWLARRRSWVGVRWTAERGTF